ncbi:lytic murein transglycosylase [Phenylobacterium sp. SCN 70-31]|uniref:lytic murein transglycosylase n=1 Tax=Phenylobacterium sp. SCN 70-31 TaxID=1660129 RepID=UPI00086EB9E5|nr:lytic murein transglycosylase [Phenylobacterium sp. SCN 70-31]ODT87220.1 MAG: peptidoglycan-binding protein [Phenylobacterium sp. SCN 70-31]
MRTRLPLFLLLAGCATPVAPAASALQAVPHSATPAAADAARPAQASVAPPTASGDMIFDAWASDFQGRALAAGIDPAVFRREMAGLTPDPRIAALDSRQPEFSKPIGDYLKGVVTADRVTIGQRRRADVAEFGAIESRYGVPRDILIGIWALESGYGSIQGDNDVLRSLATLAAQGRRRAWAEGEMIATLRIIQSGEHPRSRLKGSWAGAMGQTQFIPSTYLATAVDQDGDGRRDIWGSRADALASAANLLAKAGWTRGQGWAREVTVPAGFDFGLTEGPRETPAWWADKGVRPADGRPWSAADQAAKAQLVAPAGAGGPLFLLLPNHFVLRQYNNSLAYSLGVGLLADRLGGGAGVVRPWPAETPLSLVDRMTAQRALAALGFDPGAPDGVVGMGTRRALREWQKARGLTADGYLSGDMVRRLRDEAAAKPAR